LLWVKRLITFTLLVTIIFGYLLYDKISTERQHQQAAKHALVTAQVWIATAKFRREPERFMAYRDSLLKAHSLSRERMQDYVDRYKSQPEEYDSFTKLVNQYVDSLSAIEMRLLQPDTAVQGDSIEVSE
jgi:hypothetical protein